MRRRGRIVAWCVGVALLLPQVASAAWSVGGLGAGFGTADLLPVGPTPTVVVTGRNVAISWSGVGFADGQPVGSYRIARYPAGGGPAETILSSCAGTIAGLTCTEEAVPVGSWRYGVTPVRGAWDGTEGALSAIATVAAPTFTFSSSATLLSLPTAEAGTLSGFAAGETVEFRLDAPNGALLTGSTVPGTIGAAGAAVTSTTIPAGTTDGTHTVYAVGSLGSTASATVQVDLQAPTVTAAAISKTQGGVPGYVRQTGTYYVYANVTDAGSSVSTVRADVGSVTTGATNVAMTAGSYTVAGVSYNYRSASLTSSNPLLEGAKAYSITATDANAHAATTGGFSVIVDNTRPNGVSVQAPNSSGGTVGRAETGDSLILTYSEPIEPITVVAGWDGTGGQTVTLRLIQNGGGDRIQIWNAANTVRLPLGLVRLGGTGYTATSVNFTSSTMTMSGDSVTIVLGTPSGPVTTAAVVSTMQWTPANTARDRAYNQCTNGVVTEPPAADAEF
ncbi:MAG TPA: hypothetical protein VF235_01560 [Actinomycetota bacterium]